MIEQLLAPVVGLTEGELKTLADSIIAPDRQQQIQTLLEMNRTQGLSAKTEAELDALLTEVDRVALLKARALYTLKLKSTPRSNPNRSRHDCCSAHES